MANLVQQQFLVDKAQLLRQQGQIMEDEAGSPLHVWVFISKRLGRLKTKSVKAWEGSSSVNAWEGLKLNQ